ncbi:MAG: hypothetical protein COA79_12370 [Planctomycetota bacterium]|nr:MAG: hypothetical protein COA79_12370 [Planctomycetota bacterium]
MALISIHKKGLSMKKILLLNFLILMFVNIQSQEIKKDSNKKVKTVIKSKAPKEDKSNTYKVKKEKFKITFKSKGQLVPTKFQTISLNPKKWNLFKITKLKKHGDMIKKGESIIEFDQKPLDKNIKQQEHLLIVSQLTLKESLLKLEEMKSSQEINLETVNKKSKRLNEDIKEYFKNGQKWDKKFNEDYRKRVAEYLLYNMEELRQLEKMYKEDDLTEETEEIILTRQKNSVNHMKLWASHSDYRSKQFNIKYLPRMSEDQKSLLKQDKISLKTLKESIPLAIGILEKGIEKQKETILDLKINLKKLSADKQLFNIKATMNGIVYYGQLNGEGWLNAQNSANSLKIHLNARLFTTMMTIVSSDKLIVYSQILENQLRWMNENLKGKMNPIAYPNQKYSCKLLKIKKIPSSKLKFNTHFSIKPLSKTPSDLYPGYNVNLKFTPVDLNDVISIPLPFLHEEDELKFVYLKSDNELKFIKREITTGLKNKKTILVTNGLTLDDILLKKKPKKEAAKKTKKAESNQKDEK